MNSQTAVGNAPEDGHRMVADSVQYLSPAGGKNLGKGGLDSSSSSGRLSFRTYELPAGFFTYRVPVVAFHLLLVVEHPMFDKSIPDLELRSMGVGLEPARMT